MIPPAPGKTLRIGDDVVEHRRCTCCKDSPSRFFVRRGDQIVTMCSDWEMLVTARGWQPPPEPREPQLLSLFDAR